MSKQPNHQKNIETLERFIASGKTPGCTVWLSMITSQLRTVCNGYKQALKDRGREQLFGKDSNE